MPRRPAKRRSQETEQQTEPGDGARRASLPRLVIVLAAGRVAVLTDYLSSGITLLAYNSMLLLS